jgi:ADP-ribosylglycohydrolase
LHLESNATFSLTNFEIILRNELGLVYGQCMGDAVGLATEFRTKAQASAQYASTLGCHNYRHGDRVANSHNSRWPVAAFTDDSDQMLLVLDAVLSSPRPEVGAVFLTKLDSWIREGFPGIKSPMGIGATVYTVISEFRNGETTPAKRVWQLSEGCLAANGAVMRTSIVGVPHYYDTDMTATLATKFAKATHYDPRCVASCVAVSTLVASLLRFAAAGESPSSKHCLEAALGTAREKSLESLTREHHHLVKQHELPVPKPDSKWTVYQQQDAISELIAALDARDITALDLDAENKIGYTYSCLASGVASLMSGKSFVEAICDLAMEAGDADTNCAVAGALLGCALGYNKLMEQVAPFGWEKLDCFKELVQPRLEALLEVLKKRTAGSLAL